MRKIFSLLLLGLTGTAFAQDPNFSQFFASPLTLNPLFTGKFDGSFRVGGNQRNKWLSINNAFTTVTISIDGGRQSRQTSYSKKQIASGKNASASGAVGAAAIDFINYSLTTYVNISISNDLRKLNNQLKGEKKFENGQFIIEKSAFENAYEDVNLAIESGLINSDYANNISALSQIMNVVLFGGDGTESQEILQLGRSVIENYSSQDAKNRLIITELNERITAPTIEEIEKYNDE